MKLMEDRIAIFKANCEAEKFNLSDDFLDWLVDGGFFTAPASTKYHGAYEGGLFDHSNMVYMRLKDLTKYLGLHWQRWQSPFIIGNFHDVCKMDQYKKVDNKTIIVNGGSTQPEETPIVRYEYNTNTLLKGHGTKSIMLLSQFINLTEEEMLCIRYHMGAYGNETEQKEEWAGFDAAIKKTNGLCLWAHVADQIASKIDNM